MEASERSMNRNKPICRSRRALAHLAGSFLIVSAAWSQNSSVPPSSVPPATQPSRAPQTLPAAKPTRADSPVTSQAFVASPARSSRAQVTFTNNQLFIAANDSSLNDILREIAKLTGMKITGGVNDERVYGSYGPDTALSVLSQLLDGTGTNMMLLGSPNHTLTELVLSPRNGGVTPPNPNTTQDADDNEQVPSAPPTSMRAHDFSEGGRRSHLYDRDPNNRGFDQTDSNPPTSEAFPGFPTSNNPNAQPEGGQPSQNGGKHHNRSTMIWSDRVNCRLLLLPRRQNDLNASSSEF